MLSVHELLSICGNKKDSWTLQKGKVALDHKNSSFLLQGGGGGVEAPLRHLPLQELGDTNLKADI